MEQYKQYKQAKVLKGIWNFLFLLSSRYSNTVELNIKTLNTEADKLTSEIIEQKGNLSSMEAGVAKDQKEDYIKDVEKTKKKTVNDVESSRNKITKLTSEIDRFEDDIVKNESDQQIMKDKVAKQELVVQQCSDKLAAVEAY